jgi:hypothetical protein
MQAFDVEGHHFIKAGSPVPELNVVPAVEQSKCQRTSHVSPPQSHLLFIKILSITTI